MNKLLFESQEKRAELVAVVEAMIREKLDLIEGVRQLSRLRFATKNPDDSVFNLIIGIDSETDHFPVGQFRDLCAASYLKRADRDMDRYLGRVKEELLATCREIRLMCS